MSRVLSPFSLCCISACIALLTTLAGAVHVRTAFATTPYEPNDSILNAAGPLLTEQSYVAALETANDRDFFYFYVTSPGATPTILTVTNQGGGGISADIDLTIVDSSGTPRASVSYVRQGEARSASLELEPQKYSSK